GFRFYLAGHLFDNGRHCCTRTGQGGKGYLCDLGSHALQVAQAACEKRFIQQFAFDYFGFNFFDFGLQVSLGLRGQRGLLDGAVDWGKNIIVRVGVGDSIMISNDNWAVRGIPTNDQTAF
ncbi:hypothetical protein JZU69_00800, partial [bacterium]|nr:hypothetical protein [bacterium]